MKWYTCVCTLSQDVEWVHVICLFRSISDLLKLCCDDQIYMVITLLYTGGEGNRDDLKSLTQPPLQEKTHTLECEDGSHGFDNSIYDEAQNPQTTADVGKEKHTTAGPGTFVYEALAAVFLFI